MSDEVASSQMLRRKQAARYLTEVRGLPIAAQTLAKLATQGGGPVFRRFGRYPFYRVTDLDGWVESKLGPLQRSTSDITNASAPIELGLKVEPTPLMAFSYCPKCGAGLQGASSCRRCGPMPKMSVEIAPTKNSRADRGREKIATTSSSKGNRHG